MAETQLEHEEKNLRLMRYCGSKGCLQCMSAIPEKEKFIERLRKAQK